MKYDQLILDGPFDVVGSRGKVMSAGEAIDVLIADRQFQDWLAEQGPDTWSVANVYLGVTDQDGTSRSPSWTIELFREVGVPRNWAIGRVDVDTGVLVSLSFCNDPCAR